MLSIPFWSDFILLRPLNQELQHPAFNPILVWFYLSTTNWFNFSAEHFQSHFGLILSAVYDWNNTSWHSAFNPILVWFYHTYRRSFQETTFLLSIPFWSDFIQREVRHSAGLKSWLRSLSFNPILVWFYQKLNTANKQQHFTLSIPFWSDFILAPVIQEWKSCKSFNPILVWFYLFLEHLPVPNQAHLSIPFWSDFIEEMAGDNRHSRQNFQSHFGLILSNYMFPDRTAPTPLSIPFWSDFIITW